MLFARKAFILSSIIYFVLFGITFRDAFASTPKQEAKDLGCWHYTGGEVLKDGKRTGIDKSMTTLICANDCAKLNFSYALVKYGKECTCRETMSKMDQTGILLCDFPCVGDSTIMCGGHHEKYTVLHTGYFQKSEFTRFWDYINESYVGCYMDRGPFCKDSFSDDDMSVGMCMHSCYKKKKNLAAIKNAEECCCSTTLEGTDKGSRKGCWRFCDDNPAFHCGAVLPWVAVYDIEKVPKYVMEPTAKPPPETIEQKIESNLSFYIYVGICVLAVIIMLIAICCVCRCMRGNSRSKEYQRVNDDPNPNPNPNANGYRRGSRVTVDL